MCGCLCVCLTLYAYVCVHVCVCVYACVSTYGCFCICVCACVCLRVCSCVRSANGSTLLLPFVEEDQVEPVLVLQANNRDTSCKHTTQLRRKCLKLTQEAHIRSKDLGLRS